MFERSFPPHVRGWTADFGPGGPDPGVSPACAGMDPSLASSGVRTASFPRMCGDGPDCTPGSSRMMQFPPHVRGWTSRSVGGTRGLDVSPACAGMDRG